MTQRQRRIEFRVSFILPPDTTVAEAREYVRDSVAGWDVSLDNANMRTLRVTNLRTKRVKRAVPVQ